MISILACLERTASYLFQWFSNNGMETYADKSHLLLALKKTYSQCIKF